MFGGATWFKDSQFNRIDLNGDGKHSREEYVDKGWYLTPQARSGIFPAADSNTDGWVTRAEYLLNRIITDEAKMIIQSMDADRDGLVTEDEFVRSSVKRLGGRHVSGIVFAALDTNPDGQLRVPEYLRVWGIWARAGGKSAEQRTNSLKSISRGKE